jgi:hypothetical protein
MCTLCICSCSPCAWRFMHAVAAHCVRGYACMCHLLTMYMTVLSQLQLLIMYVAECCIFGARASLNLHTMHVAGHHASAHHASGSAHHAGG